MTTNVPELFQFFFFFCLSERTPSKNDLLATVILKVQSLLTYLTVFYHQQADKVIDVFTLNAFFSSTASFVTAVGGKVRFPAAEQNREVHPRDETLSGEAADCVAQLFISQSPWQVQTKYFLYPESKGQKINKNKIHLKNTMKYLCILQYVQKCF